MVGLKLLTQLALIHHCDSHVFISARWEESEGLERLYLQRYKSRGLTPLSSETRTKTKFIIERRDERGKDRADKERRIGVLTRQRRIG